MATTDRPLTTDRPIATTDRRVTIRDRPSWWKRHYLLSDDEANESTSQLGPHLQLPRRRRTRRYTTRADEVQPVGQPIKSVVANPGASYSGGAADIIRQRKMERIGTYRGIVERVNVNDDLAKDYTGSEFHSRELLHPSHWFNDDEAQGEDWSNIYLDSFWMNREKHLYMYHKKPPDAKYTKDQLLAMKLAREAKEMNKRMTSTYDDQRMKTMTKEAKIASNNRLISKLKERIEDTEKSARKFEKNFTEANEDVLTKLDVIRREEKHINDRLLEEHQKPKPHLQNPDPFFRSIIPPDPNLPHIIPAIEDPVPMVDPIPVLYPDIPPPHAPMLYPEPILPRVPIVQQEAVLPPAPEIIPVIYPEQTVIPLLLDTDRSHNIYYPDDVWRRTRKVLETEEDKQRTARYQSALSKLYYR